MAIREGQLAEDEGTFHRQLHVAENGFIGL